MLLFLISSLFVLSNGVPLQLQPLNSFNATNLIERFSPKNLIAKLADGASAKNLIAELADADPVKVQELITLVEAMIGVAENDLNALTVASTDANAAYIAAVSTYDAAVVAQTQVVADAQTAVTDALAAKNNAEGAKTGAQSSLDAEKYRLEAELASLEQVITILRGLSESSGLSNDNGGCYLFTGEAECMRSKDGRQGQSYTDSPCDWCCGDACTSNNGNVCEPHEWLTVGGGSGPSNGVSKNGVGYDTCPTRLSSCSDASATGSHQIGENNVYCDTSDGGGWALAMQFADTGSSFTFDSTFWTDQNLVGTAGEAPTDSVDGKYEPFNNVEVHEIRVCFVNCVTLEVPSTHTGQTLYSIFTSVNEDSNGLEFSTTADEFGAAMGISNNGMCWQHVKLNFNDNLSGYVCMGRLALIRNNECSAVTANDALGFGVQEANAAGTGSGITTYPGQSTSMSGELWVR